MTETCSQVANSLIDESFTGGMKLLPGYQARIVEPMGAVSAAWQCAGRACCRTT